MKNVALAWLVAAILAVTLLWKLFQQEPAPAVPVSSAPSEKAIARLEQRIDMLESELTQAMVKSNKLERRLSGLENGESVVTQLADQDNFALADPGQLETAPSAENTVAEPETGEQAETLHERLFSAGLASETIEAIQQKIDRNRLQMLELRDRAVREGWNDTQDYAEQIHQLNDPTRGLREDFGDQVFDQYLYAAGRPNRVVVREVYSGSAADNAGIQVGDIITGYASSKVYSMSDLRQGTVQGNAGETVLVEIMRDDQPLSTTVVRGPLGISMQTASVQPR